jgi:hypothetical protein
MRALLALALTAVVAAIAVDAALILKNHPVALEHERRHAELASQKGGQNRMGDDDTGASAAYRRIYELGIAVTTKNYTWVDALIDDNAVIFISDIGCGTLTKAEFIAGIQSSPVVARYFDLGAWAGYASQIALIRGTAAAVLSPSAPLPNATVQDDKAFFVGLTNTDGSQLVLFEHISARNFQPNATAMVAAWKVLRDAAQLHDITPWLSALEDNFTWQMNVAWGQSATANKTTFLANLEATWATEASVSIQEYYSYAVCDFVVADLLWSTIFTDGTAQIQRFAMSTAFNQDMKVVALQEFTEMPWL